MTSLSANDLKIKGVSAIELALNSAPEVAISVRGKDRFVVMDLAHYHYLRECELDAALAQTRADIAAGRTVQESPESHLAQLGAVSQTPPGLAASLCKNPAIVAGQSGAPLAALACTQRQV